MKILAYNSSHETSLAQYDTETRKVDFCFEEERFRRNKYWTPRGENLELECVHHRHDVIQPEDGLFVACSYDRRKWEWYPFAQDYINDRALQRQFVKDIAEKQLTWERNEEIIEKYKDHGFEYPNGSDDNKDNREDFVAGVLGQSDDDHIHMAVAKQLGYEGFHYEFEHHLYHAECGYYHAPYRDEESAIAVVWDGGGANRLFDIAPNYQEVESIYRIDPYTSPKLQWQRLSNFRRVHDLHSHCCGAEQDTSMFAEDETIDDNGAEVVLSCYPSVGMNFSNLSHALGFDKLGRAAGKVMGAASYCPWKEYKNGLHVVNMNSICNLLELQSLEYSISVIQNAVDRNPDCKNIILSGGYALNCTNNNHYLSAFPDHNIFIDPIPHDGGTAIGGAIHYSRIIEKENSNENS